MAVLILIWCVVVSAILATRLPATQTRLIPIPLPSPAVILGYGVVASLGYMAVDYYLGYYFAPLAPSLFQALSLFGTNRLPFFVWLVNGVVGFAVMGWLFRYGGRQIGTEFSRRLFRHMPISAAFGLLTIALYLIISLFAPVIAPYGQAEIFPHINLLPGSNPAHPLGTDQLGRDLLSRLIYGGQNTVGIALITTCISFTLGISFGFLAATLGGWFDQLVSRVVDALMAIPQLIFALLLLTVALTWAGGERWLVTIYMICIIAVLDCTRVFRLSRALAMNIVVMDFFEAAKLRGEKLFHLIFFEILPNAYAPLLAEFGLRFCFVFLTIASLSFLGIGIQPPLADWGTMVKDLAQFINFAAFSPLAASLPLMPAAAIAILTIAVNFTVDWMLHRASQLAD